MKKFYQFKLAFAGLFLCLSISLSAQDQGNSTEVHDHLTCGKNEATRRYLEQNPDAAELMQRETEELEEFTRNFTESGSRSEVIIIPVVFHIVHDNGVENISNDQIYSAMEVLNEDFNAQTEGVNSVVAAFQDIVGNVEVEFRLAKKDPQGNCTNGITRTVSAETFGGGENCKSAAPTWGRSKYLNIWVCNSIGGGVAGYAYLPSGAPAAGDGILIEHSYVGRIGTGNPTRSHALSHEAGHWANLEHTWGMADSPGLPTSCSFDDFVSDTPNTIGWSTCDLNGTTCGTLDNVQNFMDYSYCSRMFTIGQSNRMRAALNSSIAQRNQLHTVSNHTATGVNAPNVVCNINFQTDIDPTICAGQALTFEDLSFNGVSSWNWTFEGGTPSSSNEQWPEVTYNTPGVYDVTLTASNANGSLVGTKSDFVVVLPAAQNSLPFAEGFESFNSLEPNNQNWFVVNPDGGNIKWALTSNAAYSGSKSVFVNGRSNVNGQTEILQSPTYSLAGLTENAVLTFKYAHARRSANSDDRLRVWISRNCGETWSVRKTINMDDLPTVAGNVSTSFVPTNQSQWAEVVISNIVSTFLTDEFRIRFEFTSHNGNNIYIDNINLVDGTTVGITEFLLDNEIVIYPNPTNGQTQLQFNLLQNSNLNIELFDISGRNLAIIKKGQTSAGEHRMDIDLGGFAPGVYFVRFIADGNQITKRIVLQN